MAARPDEWFHRWERIRSNSGRPSLACWSLAGRWGQRSFVNPDPRAPREQKGHHMTERSVYEFMARVPAAEVTPNTIGRITLRIYRIKEEARVDRLGDAPLGRQFQREMRLIAELVSLPESVLPEAIERRSGRSPSV